LPGTVSNPESGPAELGPASAPPVSLPDCGDFQMRIGRDGTWYYQGSPIGRRSLVKLFSTVLRREDDGQFWLVTPVERGRIIVEDAPFTAVEVMAAGKGRDQELFFRTNLDEEIRLDAAHPLRVAGHARASGETEPRPYILVRDRLEALVLRSVFYHLVTLGESHAVSGHERFGIWSAGLFFPLDANTACGAP